MALIAPGKAGSGEPSPFLVSPGVFASEARRDGKVYGSRSNDDRPLHEGMEAAMVGVRPRFGEGEAERLTAIQWP